MRRHTTTAGLLAVALLAGGCGSDEDEPSRPAPAAGPAVVTIKDFSYAPESLTVRRGVTLTFTNRDRAPHTATSSAGGFDTGVLEQGQAKKVTLKKAGTFSYICSLHPYMRAAITVTG